MSETLNLSLVALTPAEIAPAQAQLADWCKQKMISLGQEYRDLRENLESARVHKWKTSALARAVSKCKRRITYYRKIRAAVQAGFLIVPNFPIEVIAVRVKEGSHPPWNVGQYPSDVNEAQPARLPPGEGKYVDEITNIHELEPLRNPDGSIKRRQVEAGQFNEEVDFPTTAIKPIIMDATARAMAQKLFDRVGIAWKGGQTTSMARRRSDPVVIGQVLGEKRYGQYQCVSFFIAWWLNTEDL